MRLGLRLEQGLFFLVGLVLALVPGGCARALINLAGDEHWALELLVILVAAALSAFTFVYIARANPRTGAFGKHPKVGLANNLVIAAMLATVTMGGLTGLLFRAGLVIYDPMPQDSAPILDFYAWHLIDSIPVLEVWKATGISAPFETRNWVSGWLLLGYQVLVISTTYKLYRKQSRPPRGAGAA